MLEGEASLQQDATKHRHFLTSLRPYVKFYYTKSYGCSSSFDQQQGLLYFPTWSTTLDFDRTMEEVLLDERLVRRQPTSSSPFVFPSQAGMRHHPFTKYPTTSAASDQSRQIKLLE
jgi:hypothetical protein